MQVEFVTVKYMHCHISLYLNETSGISKNKTKIANFPLYFLFQQQFVEENIKA